MVSKRTERSESGRLRDSRNLTVIQTMRLNLQGEAAHIVRKSWRAGVQGGKGRHGVCRAEEAEKCQEVRAGERRKGRHDMDQYTSRQSSDLLGGTEVT